MRRMIFKKEVVNALLKFVIRKNCKWRIGRRRSKFKCLIISLMQLGAIVQLQQEYRFNTLLTFILQEITELETKDPKRDFTNEQRLTIYYLNEGICQICNKKVEFKNFHADHIIPHSKGGLTKVSNGQVTLLNM